MIRLGFPARPVENGDRHRAGEVFGVLGIYICSEPVPVFHFADPIDNRLSASYDG